MTSNKDLCDVCLHPRGKHQSIGGCGHTEKDRLGFVRELCDCLGFVEDTTSDKGLSNEKA
jgi:hypothetical protein